MSNKKSVHLNLKCSQLLVDDLLELVRVGRYDNLSEAVRSGIRMLLEEEKRKAKEAQG